MNTSRPYVAAAAAAAFVGTVYVANFATERWGFLTVGPVSFTAGTLAAGLAFGLRDVLHEAVPGTATKKAGTVAALIVVGAALSWYVAPALAVASGLAFLLSELLDLGVYLPLRRRHKYGSVVASNLAGGLLDTIVFLGVAFGTAALTFDAVFGQMVGKAAMILPALILVRWMRRAA